VLRKALNISEHVFAHDKLLTQLVPIVVETLGEAYPEMAVKQQAVIDLICHEQEVYKIELAKLANGLLEELFAILGFADMALQTVDIQVQFAQLCQSRVHILLLATADDHCGAIFGQPFGNRETNAGGDSSELSGCDPLQFLLSCLPIGGGGDHGYFSCQTLHRAGCRTLTTAGQAFVAFIEIRANKFSAVIVAVLIET